MCVYCLNARIDHSLTSDNDLSYISIGTCEKGRSMYIRSGDGRPTAIVVSQWMGDRNDDVALYIPKYCPECGRVLFENRERGNFVNNRYSLISHVFSYGELILLEDALRKFEQSDPGFSDKGKDLFDRLFSDIIMARRWLHQFGKSQH